MKSRKGTGSVIATLLLLVIVVAMASTVYAFTVVGFTQAGQGLDAVAATDASAIQGNIRIAVIHFDPDLTTGFLVVQNPSPSTETIEVIQLETYQLVAGKETLVPAVITTVPTVFTLQPQGLQTVSFGGIFAPSAWYMFTVITLDENNMQLAAETPPS